MNTSVKREFFVQYCCPGLCLKESEEARPIPLKNVTEFPDLVLIKRQPGYDGAFCYKVISTTIEEDGEFVVLKSDPIRSGAVFFGGQIIRPSDGQWELAIAEIEDQPYKKPDDGIKAIVKLANRYVPFNEAKDYIAVLP